MWTKFTSSLFAPFNVIWHYKIYEEYIMELFNDVVDDGLQHICLRLIGGSIKNENDEVMPEEEVVKMIERCRK